MLCLFILRPEHLNVSSFSMFQDSFERKERHGCDIDRLGGLYLIFHHFQCFKTALKEEREADMRPSRSRFCMPMHPNFRMDLSLSLL